MLKTKPRPELNIADRSVNIPPAQVSTSARASQAKANIGNISRLEAKMIGMTPA